MVFVSFLAACISCELDAEFYELCLAEVIAGLGLYSDYDYVNSIRNSLHH